MKKLIYERLLGLKNELNTTSNVGSKHPTDVGEIREEHLRSFLNDFFPYYDAFKGNISGKSCDFILADNKYHPKLSKLVGKKDYYPHVFPSLVDTIIELKGIYNEKSLFEGMKQAFEIKSFIRDKRGQRGVTKEFDTPKSFLSQMTIRQGIIFIEGKFEWNKINKVLQIYLQKNENSSGVNITNSSISFERFYKLPDFLYFIENDDFVLISKGDNIFNLTSKTKGNPPSFAIQKFDSNGMIHLLATIEIFSNERNNMQEKRFFQLEMRRHKEIDTRAYVAPLITLNEKTKWIEEDKFKDPYNPEQAVILKLIKLLNLKTTIEF